MADANPGNSPLARLGIGFTLAMLLLAVIWFGGLEYRGLFRPDEGRYAEIPREMLASGDWVTPRLNDLKYFEKPPLQYWATAASFALFGEDEWTARLWPAITGFLGVLLVIFAGNRIGPPGAGYAAGLVLATSWGYFLSSQLLTLDMGLTFFLTLALTSFLLAQDERATPQARRNWMLLCWAGMALAVLSKGLIGVVLFGLALVLYALAHRDGSVLRNLEWKRGLPLFAAIAAPWFILVQIRNPEFFRFFFIQEHFQRYLLPDHHRPGSVWYFVPILLIGMLPWTASLAGTLRRAWGSRRDRESVHFDRLLVLWVLAIVAFFSLSQSKLPAYVLPAMPALALLIGRDLARQPRVDMKWLLVTLVVAGLVLLGFAPALPSLRPAVDLGSLVNNYLPWLAAGAFVLISGAWMSWKIHRAGSAPVALMVLAFSGLIGSQVAVLGLHSVDARYSSETFAEDFLGEDQRFAPGAPFYSVGDFDETLPFYLGRTLTLVAYRGELAPGVAAEPDKYVASLDEFSDRWMAASDAYATMSPALFTELSAAGLPMRVLAQDRWRIIVARSGGEPILLARNAGKVREYMRALHIQ